MHPPTAFQVLANVANTNTQPRTWGLDHESIAEVHGDVVSAAVPRRVVPADQVSGLETAVADSSSEVGLLVRDAGQVDACLGEDALNEARAIHAGLEIGPTPDVRDAYGTLRVLQDRLAPPVHAFDVGPLCFHQGLDRGLVRRGADEGPEARAHVCTGHPPRAEHLRCRGREC